MVRLSRSSNCGYDWAANLLILDVVSAVFCRSGCQAHWSTTNPEHELSALEAVKAAFACDSRPCASVIGPFAPRLLVGYSRVPCPQAITRLLRPQQTLPCTPCCVRAHDLPILFAYLKC